jgi:hypothetical protein
MTGNGAQEYNIAAIRKLLLAAFTPQSLRVFCYDRSIFRPVVNTFGPDQGLDAMVDELVTYCDTRLLFAELLPELKQQNPRQYARFFGPEPPTVELEEPQEEQHAQPTTEVKKPGEEKSAPPTPELALSASDWDTLIITRPFRLDLVCIPAGEFQMGSDKGWDKRAEDDELPATSVHVPEFRIGRYPVTNRQYQVFLRATGRPTPFHFHALGPKPSPLGE